MLAAHRDARIDHGLALLGGAHGPRPRCGPIAPQDKAALEEVLDIVAGEPCWFMALAEAEKHKVVILPTSFRTDSVAVHIPMDSVVRGHVLVTDEDVAAGGAPQPHAVAVNQRGQPIPHPSRTDRPSNDPATFRACVRGLFNPAALSVDDLLAVAVEDDQPELAGPPGAQPPPRRRAGPPRVVVIDPGVKAPLVGFSCPLELWLEVHAGAEAARAAAGHAYDPRAPSWEVPSPTSIPYRPGDATVPSGFDCKFPEDALYRTPDEIEWIKLSRGQYDYLTGARTAAFRGRRSRSYSKIADQIEEVNANGELSVRERHRAVRALRQRARRMGWRPEALDAREAELRDAGSLKVGTLAALEAAAVVRLRILLDGGDAPVNMNHPQGAGAAGAEEAEGGRWWRFYGSRVTAQLRFEGARRRAAGMATILRRFAPGRHDIVCIGDFAATGRRGQRGEHSGRSPVVALRRYFSTHRRTLLLSEWGTTMRCVACRLEGHDAQSKMISPFTRRARRSKREVRRLTSKYEERYGAPAPAGAISPFKGPRRINATLHCPQCQRRYPRDPLSALNQSNALYSTVVLGQRAAYLQPPPPAAAAAAAAAANGD